MSEIDSGKNLQHLLIAAFAGALLVFALKTGTDRILLPSKTATVAKVAGQAAQSTPQIQQSTPEEVEIAHQEAERQATIAKQDRLKREKEQSEQDRVRREQKLQDALAAREAAAAQAKKDAAWQRFYKKPKKCDNPSDNSIIVECSNHYLREEQRFEKLYSDGKL